VLSIQVLNLHHNPAAVCKLHSFASWLANECLGIYVVYKMDTQTKPDGQQMCKHTAGAWDTYRLLLSGHVASCTVAIGVRMNTKGLSGWSSSLALLKKNT
jgi:hypothetical protein